MTQGRKRTKIALRKKSATVTALSYEDMVLNCGNGKRSYLNRLCYVNVPTIKQIASGNEILANRDNIVRTIFETLQPLPDSKSKESYFTGLVDYFRYVDAKKYRGNIFDNEIMQNCLKHFNKLRNKGQHLSKASSIKLSLSFFLRQWNREADLKTLPEVPALPPSSGQAFHVETELKPLSRILIKGALAFRTAIEKKEYLDIHPFFDEKLFLELAQSKGWSKRKISCQKRGFKDCMRSVAGTIKDSPLSIGRLNQQAFYNHASRNWFFVFSMMTGMNKSVLAQVRYGDVAFKNIGNGRFVFDGEKFRAGFKDLDNAVGFSKRTKELINGWLTVSKIMYQSLGIPISSDLPLCPFFNRYGEVLTFDADSSNIGYINAQLEKVTGLRITTKRFRATKSDVLMRVTEDMFLVSQGLNDTVNVVAKRYSSGVQADHDNNLNATFSALNAISKGEDIGKAIENAKVMHSDILSDYDYKNLRNGGNQSKPLMTTPSGIKCSGATPEKLIAEARRMKKLGIDFSKDTGRCTDFIGCFDCDRHKLVASENDIWLMLSFLEQIEGLKEMVASNSVPKEEYFWVEGVLKKALVRLKNKAPKNYESAKCKMENGNYHPLYQNRASANLFF
ncbi:TPA: hypothetical protein ACVU44_000495 [Vibrio parahaemolyticus]|uniref:hypothetical protein n=1 Tax=Vibrio parahaemolyticus TaxID=670 RepID=UPI0017861171|nr:hypothetical protein [Vibrio parahaemolyticus]MBD6969403.1 hypothetical protein [Vibrio parahaemolyticus]MBD6974013.1 hypothetical protein [Vibrio parahaemolyticus]